MTEIKVGDGVPMSTVTASTEPNGGDPVGDLPVKAQAGIGGLVAWAALSLSFLAFIAFGSVDARIWRFNDLRIESRSVLRIWTLQAESLPRVAEQWILSSLFYGCILVVIASTVIGIWFLLDSAGTGTSKSETPSHRGHESA